MIFSYLYYSFYNTYKNFGEDSVPGGYAVGIITLLQWLPLYSVITLLKKLHLTTFKVDKPLGLICLLLFLAINSLYFLPKGRHKRTFSKIESLPKEKLKVIRTIAIIYSVTAFFLLVTILML